MRKSAAALPTLGPAGLGPQGQGSKRAFEKIAAGIADAISIANESAGPETFRVHIPETIDVKAIRKRRDMTQPDFAPALWLRPWSRARLGTRQIQH